MPSKIKVNRGNLEKDEGSVIIREKGTHKKQIQITLLVGGAE